MYGFYQPRSHLRHFRDALRRIGFTNCYTRVGGGFEQDITPLVIEKDPQVLPRVSKTLDDMERLLNRNKIFHDRTKGVWGPDQRDGDQQKRRWSDCRASGVVTRDLPKDEPYLAYKDFDFKVCCAKAATAWPLHGPHGRDARESEDRQASPRKHSLRADQRRARRTDDDPEQEDGLLDDRGDDLALRTNVSNRGFEVPHEEVYSAIEAPNGELGFYLVGDGSDVAIVLVAARRVSLTLRCSRILIRGHTLKRTFDRGAGKVLNIIAAETRPLGFLLFTDMPQHTENQILDTGDGSRPSPGLVSALSNKRGGGDLAGDSYRQRCVALRANASRGRDRAVARTQAAEVQDTLSFYGIFKQDAPHGQTRAWICRSVSCMLRGGYELLDHMCAKTGLHPGECTDDGKLTVEYAECLGRV